MPFRTSVGFLLLALLIAVTSLHAQRDLAAHPSADLTPDAPQPFVSASYIARPQQRQSSATAPTRYAPRFARYIQPDEAAQPLSAKEKLELSVREQLRPYAFSTQVVAAGWQHLLDNDPKYGSDSAGFGERLGAAAIRQDSSAFLSDGVFPALFRQDPRYYRKGSGKILDRATYSASRIVVTRTDRGDPAPNYSRFAGSAGAYALTMTYYPAVSATWSATAEGYFFSLLTGAMGNELHEFLPDLLHLARLKIGGKSGKRPPGT